ncbi:transposase [Streptomyces sp. NPDC093594]|uniref:transposase n=1 Tax=Streptomyces sp. NPDC093594 TaxID=3155305 RepID=UPI00344ECB3F
MRQDIGGRDASAAEWVGKRANCQVAVSDHAANDTASGPWEGRLHLPREWTNEPDRCRRRRSLLDMVHQEKWRLVLDLLDTFADWQLTAPVVVADADYGISTPCRAHSPGARAVLCLALTGQDIAHLGGCPAAKACLRRTRTALACPPARTAMTSRFAVLTVRPAGKQYLAQPKRCRRPQRVGRRPARPDTPRRVAGGPELSGGLPDIAPACHHPGTELTRWAKTR